MILLTILGSVLVVEGLVLALAPSRIEDLLAALQSMDIETRRLFGLVALASGTGVLWLAMS